MPSPSLLALPVLTGVFLFSSLQTTKAQIPQTPPTVRVQTNILVPMRDGVHLAADLYLPNQTGPFPVLLTRTPYNKNRGSQTARRYAEQGYAVVVMDSRGIHAS